jgi:hypothetical protein
MLLGACITACSSVPQAVTSPIVPTVDVADATGTLERHDFNIVNVAGWDSIARENVGIAFDLVAAPERVTVEEVP